MKTAQKQAFKPGDIVWAKDNEGEFAGIVLRADDTFVKVECKESEHSTSTLVPGYPPEKVRHAKASDFKGKPAWLQKWYEKKSPAPKVVDVSCIGVRTADSRKKKAEPPLTLAEIKQQVAPIVKSRNHCVSGRFRIDSRRHAIVLTVRNGNLVDAKAFAEYLEGFIQQNFNQTVPVDVVKPKEYDVRSTGKSVWICHGEAIADPLGNRQALATDDGLPADDPAPVPVAVLDDDDWF
jgi:hypothetical protein